jgi:hypothetical protein
MAARKSAAFAGVWAKWPANFAADTPQNQQPTEQPVLSSTATEKCTMPSALEEPTSKRQRSRWRPHQEA